MAVVLRTLALIAVGVLLTGLATGCGSDDDGDRVATDTASSPSTEGSSPTEPAPTADKPSASPAPASWPACGDVWVEGADLPSPYAGCARDGAAVAADRLHCSMGALLVTYDDRFWGVPGHEISRAQGALRRDPRFRQARGACTA